MNKYVILAITILAVAALFTGCSTAQQNSQVPADGNVGSQGADSASLNTVGDLLVDPSSNGTEIGAMI